MLEPDKSPRCHALIVAAGRGTRFGGPLPKQYCQVGGAAVLRRTAMAFLAHPQLSSVRVAINPADEALYADAVRGLSVGPAVAGGASRQESVRNLLEALDAAPDDIVL